MFNLFIVLVFWKFLLLQGLSEPVAVRTSSRSYKVCPYALMSKVTVVLRLRFHEIRLTPPNIFFWNDKTTKFVLSGPVGSYDLCIVTCLGVMSSNELMI